MNYKEFIVFVSRLQHINPNTLPLAIVGVFYTKALAAQYKNQAIINIILNLLAILMHGMVCAKAYGKKHYISC